jgi:3-hydroxyisobutyrate dehydrogenase
MNVSFIGLGVMGYPMAGHLARSGHRVRVYNRTAARAAQWITEYPGSACPTPREASIDSDVVFCCVGNDDDLRSVTLGDDGAFAGMNAGSIFVDHTTTSARVARELAAVAAESGIGYLDAPVSGGQAGAENGQLTVMIGGSEAVCSKVYPLIECYSRMQARLGDVGAGQLTKMVNQICLAGTIQGLAEAIHFASRAGLDAHDVINVISKGAAQSWQMDNRAATMIEGEFDHGFAVEWMRKDLGYALQEARDNGSQLPVAALVDQFYAQVQALGGSRWDTSSLLTALDHPE